MSHKPVAQLNLSRTDRYRGAVVGIVIALVLITVFLGARAWRVRSQPGNSVQSVGRASSEAQELYLQGRYFLARGGASRENQMESVHLFEKAIEKAPSFALAYAGLATAYNGMAHAEVLNYTEAFSKAKTAAKKALEIDAKLSEAHSALADTLVEADWDWAGAGAEFRRALELDPNSPLVHYAYARYLAKLARFPEAISEAERVLQLEPTSLTGYHMIAYCYYGAHQPDKGLEQIRKAGQLNLISPNSFLHADIGWLYLQKGDSRKAIDELRILGDPPSVVGTLGNAYARAGQRREAMQMISKLKELVKNEGIGRFEIAEVYAGFGSQDEALFWLQQSCTARDKNITYLRFEPLLDPLRSDPRFTDLLHRVGLAN